MRQAAGRRRPRESFKSNLPLFICSTLGQGDSLDADVFTIPFPHNGTLMLCSDGLWGVVAEQDIVRSVTEAPNLHRACQNLVTAANTAGGPDNISVVLIQMIG